MSCPPRRARQGIRLGLLRIQRLRITARQAPPEQPLQSRVGITDAYPAVVHRWVRSVRRVLRDAAVRAETRLTARLPVLGVALPAAAAVTSGTVRDCTVGAFLVLAACLPERGVFARASRKTLDYCAA